MKVKRRRQASRQIVTKMLESEKYMVAPLALHGSEQIGAVSVEDNPDQPLSEEDKVFVEQVAEQVALALESARLFAQTQNTLGETEDLYRGSAELSVASNYDEVLSAIRKSVDKAQEAHILSIGLFDHPWTDASPAESVDIIATWSSLPAEVVAHFPRHFNVSESPMTMALKPNEPSVVEDAMTDPELDPQIRGMLLNALSTRSAINAPLMVGGQWLGFMSISYPSTQEVLRSGYPPPDGPDRPGSHGDPEPPPVPADPGCPGRDAGVVYPCQPDFGSQGPAGNCGRGG